MPTFLYLMKKSNNCLTSKFMLIYLLEALTGGFHTIDFDWRCQFTSELNNPPIHIDPTELPDSQSGYIERCRGITALLRFESLRLYIKVRCEDISFWVT